MERGVVTKAKEEEADRASREEKPKERESPGAQRKHYILFLSLGKNRM